MNAKIAARERADRIARHALARQIWQDLDDKKASPGPDKTPGEATTRTTGHAAPG